MPATRSQAREIINHLKTEPYYIAIHNRVKAKHPKNATKIEELLTRKITPPHQDIMKALAEVAEASMNHADQLEREKAQMHGLHILGDILYKCLSNVRKYIFEKTKMRTSAFITSWVNHGIDDDTTEEAKILAAFVRDQAKEKAKIPSYFQNLFDRYKAWLRMYAERCYLVHGGFDDMTAQQIWESLQNIETQLNSGAVYFLDPTWKRYALEAVTDMRHFKFNWKNKQWEDKKGNQIAT